MPRPTKLTRKLIEEAVELVKEGHYTETVCQYLGIGDTTWYRWLQEGKEANSGLKREFWESIKKAEAYAEIKNVRIVQKAAESDDPKLWVAAMAFLERKYPKRWGKKDKLEADLQHSGKDGGPLETKSTFDLSNLSDEELALLGSIIAKNSESSGDN